MGLISQDRADAALAGSALLRGIARYAPGFVPDSDEFFRKVRVAESDLGRQLRIPLVPTEVFAYVPSAEDIAGLPTGRPWVEEAAYDMTRDFFQGDSWGFLALRKHPVIAIRSIRFVYPAPLTASWEVPAHWIRVDKKYGNARLVPGNAIIAAPLVSWVMPMVTAGRTIPQMIQVRYTAGLDNTNDAYPDVEDLVLKMATLSLVQDTLPAASFSESIDGMSQTLSADLSKLGEFIDTKIDRLRQYFSGVRMTVL